MYSILHYTKLLANPQEVGKEDLEALAGILQKYPYFQSARALQLKGLKTANSYLYNDALKKTAAYTTDRDILFEYITSPIFIQDQISEVIQQHDASVEEIEVETEDVSAQVKSQQEAQLHTEIKKAEAILNPKLFERKVASVIEITKTAEETETTKTPQETTPIKRTEEPADLQTDTPLEFTEKDTHSFSEWLKLTAATPIQRVSAETSATEEEEEDTKERKFQLIEKFIQEKPKLKQNSVSEDNNQEKSSVKDLSKPYTQTPEALMTETLAKVYLQQKNYSKAIQAYKILILKNPEKSGFFADQIRAIKKLTNTDAS